MQALGPYDTNLQMFIQEPREPDLQQLTFLRWLAEHGALEHDVAGPSTGCYAPHAPGQVPEELSLAA
ncbi:MAG TPA: hypothetical protein VEQ11_10830 [Chloroflexota bacterium]|nr:hypothetical protein [Chloroflexota bacterium]